MKSTFILLGLLVLNTACQEHKKVEVKEIKVENPYDDSETKIKLGELDQRLTSLESTVALNISQISQNSTTIGILQSQLSSEIVSLQVEISSLTSQINQLSSSKESDERDILDLQTELTNTKSRLNDTIEQNGTNYSSLIFSINTLTTVNNSLQFSINTILSQMVQLQSNQQVVEMVDPCPEVVTNDFKEVFFRLPSGKLVAFFEDGGSRFLTVLRPGNYRTTDHRSCNFSLDANNVIH